MEGIKQPVCCWHGPQHNLQLLYLPVGLNQLLDFTLSTRT
jgi:hypothetical protein